MSKTHSRRHVYLNRPYLCCFGCILRFCHLQFDKEAISKGCRIKNAHYGWGFRILSNHRELSFCGPYSCSKILLFTVIPVFLSPDLIIVISSLETDRKYSKDKDGVSIQSVIGK